MGLVGRRGQKAKHLDVPLVDIAHGHVEHHGADIVSEKAERSEGACAA
jgi:hypothetical protein